jgi:hypothetical protein
MVGTNNRILVNKDALAEANARDWQCVETRRTGIHHRVSPFTTVWCIVPLPSHPVLGKVLNCSESGPDRLAAPGSIATRADRHRWPGHRARSPMP